MPATEDVAASHRSLNPDSTFWPWHTSLGSSTTPVLACPLDLGPALPSTGTALFPACREPLVCGPWHRWPSRRLPIQPCTSSSTTHVPHWLLSGGTLSSVHGVIELHVNQHGCLSLQPSTEGGTQKLLTMELYPAGYIGVGGKSNQADCVAGQKRFKDRGRGKQAALRWTNDLLLHFNEGGVGQTGGIFPEGRKMARGWKKPDGCLCIS